MSAASCPSCGATFDYKCSDSVFMICPYCRSALVRSGLNFENVGKIADLKLDGSPMRLGTEGRYRGAPFGVVGRIQLQYDLGIWNEWHILFNDGRSGWLGEAQGTYAVTFLTSTTSPLPAFSQLSVGTKVAIKEQSYRVSNIESARCISGEGELPFRIGAGYEAPVIDLQGSGFAFATLDYSEDEKIPLVFTGEYVEFDDLQFSRLRDFDVDPSAGAIKTRTLKCMKCGASLTLRGMMQTASVVCSSCGAIIDVSDEDFKLIAAVKAQREYHPRIPLGSPGVLRGDKFEVIGFQRRCITVEGVGYRWGEYLLFNPYKGFRWLTEYNGHWNFVRQALDQPVQRVGGSVVHRGVVFEHFQSAEAKTEYVVGEFYWKVQAGESALVQDFVAPPLILSAEKTNNEITWSLGEYVEPDEIAAAFHLKTSLPQRIGVYANQPSPHARAVQKAAVLAVVFMSIALLIQGITLAISQNALVYEQRFDFSPAQAEKAQVTPIFELNGRTSNVIVDSSAGVDNAWLFLNLALINDDTGVAYDFGREISYYWGRDGDGPWSEGSKTDHAVLSSIPSGRYYLRVEPEGIVPASYAVQIYRDVPQWRYFLITAGMLLIMPVAAWVRSRSFEQRRWSESDHPMTGVGSLLNQEQ